MPITPPPEYLPLGQAHRRVTGLSGNEIYCLNKVGMQPGNLVLGNSVFSLGIRQGLSAGFKNLAGGEITEITASCTKVD